MFPTAKNQSNYTYTIKAPWTWIQKGTLYWESYKVALQAIYMFVYPFTLELPISMEQFHSLRAFSREWVAPLALASPFACGSRVTSRISPKWRACLQVSSSMSLVPLGLSSNANIPHQPGHLDLCNRKKIFPTIPERARFSETGWRKTYYSMKRWPKNSNEM